ncbi:hypothetical protein A4A49_62805, partial [Nicotiana attenuata]
MTFGIQVPLDRVFGSASMEDFDHLYFGCPKTNSLWDRMLRWLGFIRQIGSWQNEILWISNQSRSKNWKAEVTTATFAMVVYCIWRERNSIIFNKGRYNIDEVCKEMAIHIHIHG